MLVEKRWLVIDQLVYFAPSSMVCPARAIVFMFNGVFCKRAPFGDDVSMVAKGGFRVQL